MGIRNAALPALFAASGLALAGCGHDNGWYYNADPSGIYEGTLTDTASQQTTPVVAVIDENGNGRAMAQNGAYYALDVGTSGNSVYGQYLAFPGNGTSNSGPLQGQLLNDGANLNIDLNATGVGPLALALNYNNALYTVPSSLPTLQGMWTYTSSSFTLNLSIASTGSFTGTDSNNCTYNGFFTLVDPQFNAYNENFTLTCGSSTIDNYFGLSYFIPAVGSSSGGTTTPAMINFLADDGTADFVSAEVQYTGP